MLRIISHKNLENVEKFEYTYKQIEWIYSEYILDLRVFLTSYKNPQYATKFSKR